MNLSVDLGSLSPTKGQLRDSGARPALSPSVHPAQHLVHRRFWKYALEGGGREGQIETGSTAPPAGLRLPAAKREKPLPGRRLPHEGPSPPGLCAPWALAAQRVGRHRWGVGGEGTGGDRGLGHRKSLPHLPCLVRPEEAQPGALHLCHPTRAVQQTPSGRTPAVGQQE